MTRRSAGRNSPSRGARTQARAAARDRQTVMAVPEAIRRMAAQLPRRPPCPIDSNCRIDHLRRRNL